MRTQIDSLSSFLNKIFRKVEEIGSKEKAKERLRLVLISDRANISPQILEVLKEDLISTISKYMEIDVDALEVHLEKGDTAVAITASMPVKKVKRKTKD